MPRVLARESANGTPIAALVITNLSVQVFLLLVLVVDDALDFMLKLDTALTLVPVPARRRRTPLKLALTRETYAADEEPERRRQLLVGDARHRLLRLPALRRRARSTSSSAASIYAPGTLLYVIARREHRARVFRPVEAVACVVLCLLAVLALVLLARGTFDLL